MLGPRVVSAEVPETKVCSKLPSLLQTLRRPFAFANCKQRRNFPEKETIREPKPTLRCQKRRKIGFGGASKPKNPQNEALSKENPALRSPTGYTRSSDNWGHQSSLWWAGSLKDDCRATLDSTGHKQMATATQKNLGARTTALKIQHAC